MKSLLAQVSAPTDFKSLIDIFLNFIDSLLPILAGLSLLAFFYGLVVFITKSGDAKSHADGRKFMLWGIIALFVLVSFMAIISLFYQDLGFGNSISGFPGLRTHP
jgi:hypothetical protein